MPCARCSTASTQRLHFLAETGLGYLTLEREYATLSGGEAQRVRLATQLGMGLVGVIYVLDEPSIGLHPHDNQRLLADAARTARPRQHRARGRARRRHDPHRRRIDRTRARGRHRGRADPFPRFTPADCIKLPASRFRAPAPIWPGKLGVGKDAKTKEPDGRWLTVKGSDRAQPPQRRGEVSPSACSPCVTGVSRARARVRS